MWDGVKGAELHLRYMSIGSSANLVIREKNRLVYFWAMTHTSVLKCRAFCMSLFHLALFLHLCLCLTTSLSLPRLSVSLALCLVVFLSLSFLLNVPPVCLSLSVLHPSLFPCLTLCLSHSFFFFYMSLSLFLSISHPCLWQWWSSGSSVWALNGFCCIFLLNSHRHETSLTQREGWQTDDREDWALSFFLFFSSVCVCVCVIYLCGCTAYCMMSLDITQSAQCINHPVYVECFTSTLAARVRTSAQLEFCASLRLRYSFGSFLPFY